MDLGCIVDRLPCATPANHAAVSMPHRARSRSRSRPPRPSPRPLPRPRSRALEELRALGATIPLEWNEATRQYHFVCCLPGGLVETLSRWQKLVTEWSDATGDRKVELSREAVELKCTLEDIIIHLSEINAARLQFAATVNYGHQVHTSSGW